MTDDTFGGARPQHEAIGPSAQRYLAPLVASGRIPVLGGFVGSTPEGATTTLGRGGSDYTAALVAAGVGASEVQIWTDVDGVFTADPRVVDRPSLIPALSFHEAYELARFGARVLHWGTLEPAASDDIPIRVVNTCRRGAAGTAVGDDARALFPLSPACALVAHLHETFFGDGVRPRQRVRAETNGDRTRSIQAGAGL